MSRIWENITSSIKDNIIEESKIFDKNIKVYSIEGNIGCGKTTVINKFKEMGYTVFEENITDWGILLNYYYSDRRRWAFTLQIKILICFIKQFMECVSSKKEHKDNIIFMERSMLSSNIFIKMCDEERNFTAKEKEVLKDFYDILFTKQSHTIYIDLDPDECLKRIKTRGRQCEKNIDIDYLKKIHNEYHNMIKDNIFPNLVFIDSNSNKSPEFVSEYCRSLIFKSKVVKILYYGHKDKHELRFLSKSTVGSVGHDLSIMEDVIIPKHSTVSIPTGICIEMDKNMYAHIKARSSILLKSINIDGVIDSDYRGEIKIICQNFSSNDVKFKCNQKIAQIIFIEYPNILFSQVDELSPSTRGSGGFGSTNKEMIKIENENIVKTEKEIKIEPV